MSSSHGTTSKVTTAGPEDGDVSSAGPEDEHSTASLQDRQTGEQAGRRLRTHFNTRAPRVLQLGYVTILLPM